MTQSAKPVPRMKPITMSAACDQPTRCFIRIVPIRGKANWWLAMHRMAGVRGAIRSIPLTFLERMAAGIRGDGSAGENQDTLNQTPECSHSAGDKCDHDL